MTSAGLLHWSLALPTTTLGPPKESPVCGLGLFPLQCKLPRMVLLAISLPSGSAVVLPLKSTLCMMVSRKKPNQQDCHPVIVRWGFFRDTIMHNVDFNGN